MTEREWCIGSGVAGDPLEGGHHVPIEWHSVAWLPRKDNPAARVYTGSKPRCRHCERTRSDYTKSLDRDLVKARNAISAHARRYAVRWDCSVTEARRRLAAYGWIPETIAQFFRDARAAGICKECRWSWDFGEHEMTLDVSDPDTLPVMSPDTRCNVSVMCRTCNTRKRSMTLVAWRQFQAYVRAILGADVVAQLSLLDLLDTDPQT